MLQTLKLKFINIIGANVFFYKLYYKVVLSKRRNSADLPNKNHDVYIDGYPRSTNTFWVGCVKHVFKDKLIFKSHHLHTVAAKKNCIKT